jgi:zinc and cadmium transporter
LGFATTIAIILHEIPQEMGDFGVLLHAGMTPKKALIFNLLSSLTAVVGAIVAYFVGCNVEEFSAYIVPITAGSFIYMAGSDLIPELHHDTNPRKSAVQLLLIIFGIAMMLLMRLGEGAGCC